MLFCLVIRLAITLARPYDSVRGSIPMPPIVSSYYAYCMSYSFPCWISLRYCYFGDYLPWTPLSPVGTSAPSPTLVFSAFRMPMSLPAPTLYAGDPSSQFYWSIAVREDTPLFRKSDYFLSPGPPLDAVVSWVLWPMLWCCPLIPGLLSIARPATRTPRC